MAARTPRLATTADVRAWAQETNWKDEATGHGVSDRGRMPSSLVQAFNKAHKRNNIEYTNGGRIVGEQQPAAPAKATTAPRSQSASNGSATAGRATSSTRAAQPTETPSTPMSDPSTTQGLSDLIAALSAASNGSGKGKGTPIVLTAHALVYA